MSIQHESSIISILYRSTVMKFTLVVLVITLFGSSYTKSKQHSCGECLFLSPYIKQGQAALARNLSTVDPASYCGLKSHAGFINSNEKYNSQHFFWFFPAEDLVKTPWIIWLGGGPGITALKGLFEVMGPLRIENGEVKLRDITWASDYSLLFLDVPVGAGFSFTESEDGYPNNEDDVGAQMLTFLNQFLLVFPELVQAPLFIAGQSYAGKYVPALAIQIHRQRLTHPINLRGIAMGNGLIDPRNTMRYSELCTALGILDDDEIEELRKIEEAAEKYTDEGQMVDAANKFNETIVYIQKHSGVNIYNFLEHKPSTEAPAFEIYLNKPETRKLIHVGNATFHYNNQKVYQVMLPDIMNSTKPFVEKLLEHYGVMSYSGQLDIIVAYSLSRNFFKRLHWSRRSEYLSAPRNQLHDNNEKIVAYYKGGGNFVDVLIRDAGHSAPSDQPEVVKFIIDNFIETFVNSSTKQISSFENATAN